MRESNSSKGDLQSSTLEDQNKILNSKSGCDGLYYLNLVGAELILTQVNSLPLRQQLRDQINIASPRFKEQ